MKKFLKTLGIIAIVLVCIAGVYLFACGSLISEISTTPVSAPAQFVTDFTLLEEDSYEVSAGDISMRIPTHYVTTNVKDYYIIAGESKTTKGALAIYYKPVNHVAQKLNLNAEFKEYTDALALLEEHKPGYPANLLFDVPEDMFQLLKKVATANKNNVQFWNLASALETSYYLDVRQNLNDAGFDIHAIYERDNVRAVVFDSPELDVHMVMLIPKYDPENFYFFGVETSDLNEIIKMLNTFEYTTGLGF